MLLLPPLKRIAGSWRVPNKCALSSITQIKARPAAHAGCSSWEAEWDKRKRESLLRSCDLLAIGPLCLQLGTAVKVGGQAKGWTERFGGGALAQGGVVVVVVDTGRSSTADSPTPHG